MFNPIRSRSQAHRRTCTRTRTRTRTCTHTHTHTINDDGGRGAPPLGHDVLGHARVVGGVGEARLLDDQVVVDGDVEVPVLRRVDDLLVLQPLHLNKGRNQTGGCGDNEGSVLVLQCV